MESADRSCQVVLGMSWAESTPRVRIRTGEADGSTLAPLIGASWNYSAGPDSPRRCLGHSPFRTGEYKDCEREPIVGGRKCATCAANDATFAANLHHAHTRDRSELDPAIVRHLDQPNILYLAAFRDGSLKVGTSTEKRSVERLTEQGAWMARIVARTADGYSVRTLEDRITEQLGLPQAVPINRKLAGMFRPRSDERLADELDRYAAAVHDLLDVAGEQASEHIEEHFRYPSLDDSVWASLHPYPLRLDSGQHDLQVLDACGRMVAIRRPTTGDVFLADIQQLYGVEVTLGAFASDELAVQDALF